MTRAAKNPRTPEQIGAGQGAEGTARTRAYVVHPALPGTGRDQRSADGRLVEAVGLAAAIDLEVVGAETVTLRRVHPGSLFGPGRVAQLGELVTGAAIALVVIDGTLGPVQQRNLERAWKCKVIDRTGLILEIFGERAQTREGRLQVELAALSYQRSRLVRSWTHLERQRGGFGFLGGPGEAQIELDRRRIDERIARLERALDAVKRTRGLHRDARRRVPYPVIALVGYTNAGKSTLFNRLTGARVGARGQLFATLDPTMRRLDLPSGAPAILSDTVGFVAELPTDLIAAFRATLEEVRTADLVIHVRDVAHADSEAQRRDVLGVLADLGLDHLAEEGRLIEFANKVDLLDPTALARAQVEAERTGSCLGSARRGDGIAELLAELDRRLAASAQVVEVELGTEDGARLAWLYRHGRVLQRRDDETGHTRVTVALHPTEQARLTRRFPRHAIRAGSARIVDEGH